LDDVCGGPDEDMLSDDSVGDPEFVFGKFMVLLQYKK
jgi:hypothetical protein